MNSVKTLVCGHQKEQPDLLPPSPALQSSELVELHWRLEQVSWWYLRLLRPFHLSFLLVHSNKALQTEIDKNRCQCRLKKNIINPPHFLSLKFQTPIFWIVFFQFTQFFFLLHFFFSSWFNFHSLNTMDNQTMEVCMWVMCLCVYLYNYTHTHKQPTFVILVLTWRIWKSHHCYYISCCNGNYISARNCTGACHL